MRYITTNASSTVDACHLYDSMEKRIKGRPSFLGQTVLFHIPWDSGLSGTKNPHRTNYFSLNHNMTIQEYDCRTPGDKNVIWFFHKGFKRFLVE